MLASVELQVVSRLLVCEDKSEADVLLSFGDEYYSVFNKQIAFIKDHVSRYGQVPDVFTFQSEFPDVELVRVDEPLEYLVSGMRRNRQRILLLETFNKIHDLDEDDVAYAWKYLSSQCDLASDLEDSKPMNIVSESKERSEQVIEFSKQERIPTGFKEIDELMYGGLSTVEELLVIIARTNSGKSWCCTKMMETAQRNGFPVLYYSPEMQSSFLATRFDTWRGHFKNSDIFNGRYDSRYREYIESLSKEKVPAIVVEDKDFPDGVSVSGLSTLVKRNSIKLLIIDGLSYMKDDKKYSKDYDKYKHICADLFNLSKKYSCAVVVTMQANRATQDNKDENGEPFPNIYNAEGSDHPARIATQVFAIRQIFETKTLDIRLEKSRNSSNRRPVLSYVWDVNTGRAEYVRGDSSQIEETQEFSASVPYSESSQSPFSFDSDYEDDSVQF